MIYTNYFIVIKVALIATLMAIVGGFKSCKNSTNSTDIQEVELIFSYPFIRIIKGKLNLSNLKDTISVFYYNNYILYRLPTTKSFETDENIAGTEPYFLYKIDNVYGLLFKTKNDTIGTRVSVDSFLVKQGMRGRDFQLPSDSLWKFIGRLKDTGIVLEKYAVLKQGSEISLDSVYYYYSKKMENVEYSFSHHLDSLADMKLFRIRLLINQKYSPTYNLTFPKREFLFEIKEVVEQNSKDVIQFFERF
jgi:hypothetical protein